MFDVIVVGAGPAGSAAAMACTKNGFNVLLIDKNKFPRDKPCGGWITPGVLNLLGLNYEDLRKKIFVSPMRGVVVYSPSLEYFTVKKKEILSCGILRSEFDNLLKDEAVNSGVKFQEDTNFSDIEILPDRVKISTSKGIFESKVLIGADGTNSKVTKLTGIRKHWKPSEKVLVLVSETKVPRKTIEKLHSDDLAHIFYNWGGGYNWIYFKIARDKQNSYINIGAGCILSEMKNSREMYFEHLETLKKLNLLPTEIKLQKHTAWPYATLLGPKHTHGERTLLIGDAAGFSSNIAGEGIRTGMISGILAAETLSEVQDYKTDSLKLFQKKWKKKLKFEYNVGSSMQTFIRQEKDSIDGIIRAIKDDEEGKDLFVKLLTATDLENTFENLMKRI